MPAKPTHLLLDFFGTVVDYSASRTTQGYERTYDLTTRMGSSLTYDESRAAWSAAFDRLDRESAVSLQEYSSDQVAQLALRTILGRAPDVTEIQASARSYTNDWSRGVRYPDGMVEVLHQLNDHFTVAIVSNTHDVNLVQSHLGAMGAEHLVASVTTSIEVGVRKPHPAIFEAALGVLGIGPADALFVGDTYTADYLGPESAGLRAYLIDPDRTTQVPEPRRIDSLFTLVSHLDGPGRRE